MRSILTMTLILFSLSLLSQTQQKEPKIINDSLLKFCDDKNQELADHVDLLEGLFDLIKIGVDLEKVKQLYNEINEKYDKRRY